MSRKRNHSISTQFSVIFIGVMSGIVLLCILLNNVFLSSFYLREKEKKIDAVYDTINHLSEEDVTQESFVKQMNDYCLVHNISMVMMNESSQILYASMNGEENVVFDLFEYIVGGRMPDQSGRVIKNEKDYLIQQIRLGEKEYLEMIGRMPSGLSFLLRMPLESIRESTRFANRFFAVVGLLGAMFGALLIWLISKKMTRPIRQLNDISQKMVDLHFENRYTGNDHNEIGALGDNMNRLSESLEHSISELKSANIELHKDIERKEKEEALQREFVSNVSHELKTPIALIQGYAEGLKEGVIDDPDSMNYYCDVIMDEAGRMNALVKNLLTLSHLENGDESVSVERFDVAGLIANYLQNLSLMIQQENVSILYENMKEPVFVWADSFLTETVFANYFTNALHYVKANENGDKIIRVSLSAYQDTLRVSVYNSGDAIPEEVMLRIWDKFYKADKARTREYGGSGVGLSIVKAIQDRIGQSYGAENMDGGVRFWFDLPL